uniref:Uncharacterized protein n=1 Tax=Vitis vinifera TaxID=29760 RepID=F6I4F6_VITVI
MATSRNPFVTASVITSTSRDAPSTLKRITSINIIGKLNIYILGTSSNNQHRLQMKSI